MPESATRDASKPGEIKALIGARAIPPLLLVLYHYHEGHGYQHVRLFDVFVAKGYLWVEFFFALSGFVLAYVYASRLEAMWTGTGYRDFLKNRLARLYPVHLAMLVVLGVMMIVLRALAHAGGYVSVFDLASYHPDMSLKGLIANVLLIQAWHVLPHLSWNGVAWFVSVEIFVCLLFPAYLWMTTGNTRRAVTFLVLGWTVLWSMARSLGHGLDITYDWGVLRGMADFAVGVGMAMLYRQFHARVAAWPEIWLTGIQAAVFALFLFAMYHTGWSHNALDFWVVPPMTLMVLALSFDRGAFARVMQTRPLLRLGEWSYAIYMGQTAWLMLIRFAEQRLYPGAAHEHWVHIVEPIGLVIVCTLWGWLLHTLVERPANGWLRARFRSRT